MKKSVVIAIAIGLISLMAVAVYASGTHGAYGRGAHGNEAHHGAYGHGGGCAHGNGEEAHHTEPQPGQEPISEDQAREAAETFLATYLPGYSIDTIAQEEQCPCYLVTVKQANGVALQVMVDGYSGEVHHLFIPTAEEESTQ